MHMSKLIFDEASRLSPEEIDKILSTIPKSEVDAIV